MFELNANNLAPLVFALIYGPATYWRARGTGTPMAPAMSAAAWETMKLVGLAIPYGLALNVLGLQWASLAGFGLGLAFGFAGLLLILAFQKLHRRRRHWR